MPPSVGANLLDASGPEPTGDAYWVQEAQARLERCLRDLHLFRSLRPEELVRVAQRFELKLLAPGEHLTWEATQPPRLGVLVSGELTLELSDPLRGKASAFAVSPGEHWSDIALYSNQGQAGGIESRGFSVVAFLGREALDAILGELPGCAPALCQRLAAELNWKNDFLRNLQGLDSGWMGSWLYHFTLQRKRAHLRRRVGQIARPTLHAAYEHAVRDRGREPLFWVLIGFLLALMVCRAVVLLILELELQDKLFNLRPSGLGNPIHIHHFNYGFIIAFTAGLLAFSPMGRRFLKTLSFVIGFGLGLIFDEFALILNLDPNYYQVESYQAMAFVAALLVLLVYFSAFFQRLGSTILGFLRRAP